MEDTTFEQPLPQPRWAVAAVRASAVTGETRVFRVASSGSVILGGRRLGGGGAHRGNSISRYIAVPVAPT